MPGSSPTLNYGVENLPVTSSDEGRVKKAAAQAMLAKVYATLPVKNYSKVLEYCDAVLSDSQYSLLSYYGDLFDGQHENSAESLFEIQFLANVAGNWGVQMFLPPSLSNDGWKKFNTPSKELMAAYDEEEDLIRKNASVLYEDVTGFYSDDIWGNLHAIRLQIKTCQWMEQQR